MLEQFLAALRASPQPAPPEAHFDVDRRQLAVAALLIEVSQVDHNLSPEQRASVLRLVRERFALAEGAARRLVELADETLAAALDDWIFSKAVREGFAPQERLDVIRMLWEVALADGRLAPFERELVERIGAALELAPEAIESVRNEPLAKRRPEQG